MTYEVIGDKNPLTWEQFEAHVKEDIINYKKQKNADEIKSMHSPWIYRGQEDWEFGLKTTYERFLKEELNETSERICPIKFYNYVNTIIPALNSLHGSNFEKIDNTDLKSVRRTAILPGYKLLCFLRHYGFPSPLLDWTSSYYIAAFFAFYKNNGNKDISIFSYKEWSGEARGGWVGSAILNEHGHYVEAPIRHYRQQSVYTSCSAEIDGRMYFLNHQAAAESSENGENHKIKKFIIRGSDRKKVLEMLFSMNINKYTLFDDIDSLMHMLAYKEIVLD